MTAPTTAPTTAAPAASAPGPGTAGTPQPGGGGPRWRRLPDRVAALRLRGAAGGSGQAAAGRSGHGGRPGNGGSDRADEALRNRLCPPMPTDRVLGWAAALTVTVAAGLLLALDGLAFVQSRIGILDIFLMTGLVLALACLVLDRDHGRARLAALVLVGFGSSFLPWLAFPDRTMFFFYALPLLPLLPYLILGITLSAGLVLGPRTASDTRRVTGALLVGGYLITVILLFGYFYPLLASQVIPLNDWRDRMWFPSWIVA